MILLVVLFFTNSHILASGSSSVSELPIEKTIIESSLAPNNIPLSQSGSTILDTDEEKVAYVQGATNNKLFEIVLASSLTIIGGVFIYVLGQIISKFFIEPIHGQRKVIGEVADALIYYANIYTNPNIMSGRTNEASDRIRELATLLQSKTQFIPKYGFFEKLGIVIKRPSIYVASRNLIGLSNSMGRSLASARDSSSRVDSIRSALRIYSPDN